MVDGESVRTEEGLRRRGSMGDGEGVRTEEGLRL